jgi:hypothetical protein
MQQFVLHFLPLTERGTISDPYMYPSVVLSSDDRSMLCISKAAYVNDNNIRFINYIIVKRRHAGK